MAKEKKDAPGVRGLEEVDRRIRDGKRLDPTLAARVHRQIAASAADPDKGRPVADRFPASDSEFPSTVKT